MAAIAERDAARGRMLWPILIGGVLLAPVGAVGLFYAAAWLEREVLHDNTLFNGNPSPERMSGVRILQSSSSRPSPGGTPRVAWDFDGDGEPDRLTVDFFEMRPVFGRLTRGLVRVRSGRTREDVVVRGLESFTMSAAEWIGDVDGNGTDDVLAKDGARWLVLGHE